MIQCVACQRFSYQRVPAAEARRGLGHCELRAYFIRHAALRKHDCPHFQQVSAASEVGRRQWLKQYAVRTPTAPRPELAVSVADMVLGPQATKPRPVARVTSATRRTK